MKSLHSPYSLSVEAHNRLLVTHVAFEPVPAILTKSADNMSPGEIAENLSRLCNVPFSFKGLHVYFGSDATRER